MTSDSKLPFGDLVRVDLRHAWEREDTHFTPWLAREENLARLSSALGLELELVGQEEAVGPFRADVLCKDSANGSYVLIENQLERTDHTHLGQVITYAAGLDAVTIVWLAQRFTEEHRAAVDWLNGISHEEFRFFGIEIELWRIGSSPVAPKFNLVARPNDWTKAVREQASGERSEHEVLRRRFWVAFCEHLERAGSRFAASRSPGYDHWLTFGIGRSGFGLAAVAGFRDGWIAIELKTHGAAGHQLYAALEASRDEINTLAMVPLSWEFEESRKQNYVRYRRDGVDPCDESQWPDLHAWLAQGLELFDKVFRDRVAQLPSPSA